MTSVAQWPVEAQTAPVPPPGEAGRTRGKQGEEGAEAAFAALLAQALPEQMVHPKSLRVEGDHAETEGPTAAGRGEAAQAAILTAVVSVAAPSELVVAEMPLIEVPVEAPQPRVPAPANEIALTQDFPKETDGATEPVAPSTPANAIRSSGRKSKPTWVKRSGCWANAQTISNTSPREYRPAAISPRQRIVLPSFPGQARHSGEGNLR